MQTSNNITEELNSLGSTLAHMPRLMPYAVPAGYFEQLPVDLCNTANAQDEPVLELGKKLPYSVSGDYFSALPGRMLQAAKNEAVLKPSDAGTAKKIAVVPRYNWAAAAMLAIIIFAGGLITFSGLRKENVDQLLASIPQSELHEYMQHRYGVETNKNSVVNVNNLDVDNKDIEIFLNETGWE